MAITVELSSPSVQGFIEKYASIIRSVTASAISLICIMLLNKFYERVAQFLTNLGNKLVARCRFASFFRRRSSHFADAMLTRR